MYYANKEQKLKQLVDQFFTEVRQLGYVPKDCEYLNFYDLHSLNEESNNYTQIAVPNQARLTAKHIRSMLNQISEN